MCTSVSNIYTGDRFSCTCNGAYYDEALGWMVGFVHVVEEEACEEEVTQVVGAYAELEPIGRVGGLFGGGEVDGGVANEDIERHLRPSEVVDELSDAVQGGQIQVHDGVAVLGHAHRLGCSLCFEKVSARHHNIPLPCLRQSLGCGQS